MDYDVVVTLNKDDPRKVDLIIFWKGKAKAVRSVTEVANFLLKRGIPEERVKDELLRIDDILRSLAEYRFPRGVRYEEKTH